MVQYQYEVNKNVLMITKYQLMCRLKNTRMSVIVWVHITVKKWSYCQCCGTDSIVNSSTLWKIKT